MQLKLPAPHYSTLCRRTRSLQFSLTAPRKISHLVIDSSGLKLYGEGEWEARLHGMDKRRTWRKLHLAMDAATHQLTAALITEKERLDRTVLPLLLDKTEAEIGAVCADGAYDFAVCYQAIKERAARPLIPPRSDAVVRGQSPFEQRDENLRLIKKRGREQLKKESGYHRRSLVKTTFYRLKTIFTEKLKSRTMERQQVEARVRCLALNRMTALGMPESYAI